MHTKFKKMVDDICRQENFSHSELSVLIDKSRNYIGRIYRDGSSEKSIERAIMLLDRLGIKIEPTELDLVKAENEMLRKQDSHRVQVLDKRNDLLENAEFENEQLENTVKHLQTVLNERTSELEKSERYHDELLNEQSKLKHLLSDSVKSVNNYVVENSKLERQLSESEKAYRHIDEVRKQSVDLNEKLLDENKGLKEQINLWYDNCDKFRKVSNFLGWCILALLIVIGAVWFL